MDNILYNLCKILSIFIYYLKGIANMIYIDGIGLSFLIKEIKEKIVNYKLTKIYQYDRSSLSFFFGKNNLLFQVKDNSTIFYLKEEKDLNTDFQSKFLLSLKKHLLNSILINIRQESFDRIVYFDFEKLNQFGDVEKFTLIMELMGKASNIFLTSSSDEKIISALYFSSIDEGNRIIMTGAKYTLPFEEKKISPLYLDKDNFPFESPQDFIQKGEGIGKVFATQCYDNYETYKKYITSYAPLLHEAEIRGKLQKILKNIDIDLKKNGNYENYKNTGDILAANMHSIKHGMDKITAFDFYNNCEISISLDPLLSPNDNLNFYYNRYNKGKRTEIALNARLLDIRNEIKYFEEIKLFLEKETDFIGIEEIENELKFSSKKKINLNKMKKRELLSFEHNGFKIFVGRNNKENEEITFNRGTSRDIWLHVKDIPGSHVLIIREHKELDEDTLYYAARLAGEFSKAGKGDKVTVDYCEKKFVKKIKNSKPGNVTYTNFKTLTVTV